MDTLYQSKRNKSFRKNGQLLIPVLLADFFSYEQVVLTNAGLIKELHKMRVAGKTLRYAMEMFAPAFGSVFQKGLEELKKALETMGAIHDCDVCIDWLNAYIAELQSEQNPPMETDPIQTVKQLLSEQQILRQKKYLLFCRVLRKWKQGEFVQTLVHSLQ